MKRVVIVVDAAVSEMCLHSSALGLGTCSKRETLFVTPVQSQCKHTCLKLPCA